MEQQEELRNFVEWIHKNDLGETPYTATIDDYFIQCDGNLLRVFEKTGNSYNLLAEQNQDNSSGLLTVYREIISGGIPKIEEFINQN